MDDQAPMNDPTSQDDGAMPMGDAPVGGDDQSFTPPAPSEPAGDDGAMPSEEPASEAPAEGGDEAAAPEGDDSAPSDPADSF